MPHLPNRLRRHRWQRPLLMRKWSLSIGFVKAVDRVLKVVVVAVHVIKVFGMAASVFKLFFTVTILDHVLQVVV